MRLKQIPEDFIVKESFDFDLLEKGGNFAYFELFKKNYSQIKALEIICDFFNIKRSQLRFAGTKDKVGITKQIISIQNISKLKIENKIEKFNDLSLDLNLKFIDYYKKRIGLGENQGNEFEIVVRNLDEKMIDKIDLNLKRIETQGVLNFFDEQRFGFAGNSHIIGLRVLQNDLEGAVKEILSSVPEDVSGIHKKIVNMIISNWERIKNQDEVFINEVISLMPNYLRNEKMILVHLKNAKNDFPGAFRTLHKKLRTLYLNAYQSYIFNELLRKFPNEKEFPLIISTSIFRTREIEKFVEELLKKDSISRENFKLPSSPEYRLNYNILRKTRVFPKNLKVSCPEKDDLNVGKLKINVSFYLSKGEYATNIIKQLCL